MIYETFQMLLLQLWQQDFVLADLEQDIGFISAVTKPFCCRDQS